MNLPALAKKIAAAGLPALGGALGGPAGAAIATTIAGTLGVEPEPDAIARAIVNDPDAMIALRRLDAEQASEQRAHDERMLAAQIADVQNARENSKDDTVRRRLAPLLIVLPVAVLVLILWLEPSGEMLGAGMMVLGLFVALAKDAVGFYYGTSLGSSKKSAEIGAVLEQRAGKGALDR